GPVRFVIRKRARMSWECSILNSQSLHELLDSVRQDSSGPGVAVHAECTVIPGRGHFTRLPQVAFAMSGAILTDARRSHRLTQGSPGMQKGFSRGFHRSDMVSSQRVLLVEPDGLVRARLRHAVREIAHIDGDTDFRSARTHLFSKHY